MKRLLLPILICLLLFSMSACSSTTTKPQDDTITPQESVEPTPSSPQEPAVEPEQEPVQTIEFTTEGSYKLFGVMNEGLLVESSELEMESDIILQEGGTGSLSFNGESMDITKWELNLDTVSITLLDGGQADAKVHDGILELDLYGDSSMVLYYAQEGADLTGYKFLSLEEVREQLNGN